MLYGVNDSSYVTDWVRLFSGMEVVAPAPGLYVIVYFSGWHPLPAAVWVYPALQVNVRSHVDDSASQLPPKYCLPRLNDGITLHSALSGHWSGSAAP